jgi:hypothetical protein
MFKRILTLAFTLVMMLVLVNSVGAITYGQPDGNGHPYVGVITFRAEGQTSGGWRCTGTLLSPTVFLTAGHCTSGAAKAWIWFDANRQDMDGYPFGGSLVAKEIHTHPLYDDFASFPATYDLSIVILAKPVRMKTYGALPSVGLLDTLATRRGHQGMNFTVVGYGYEDIRPEPVSQVTRFVGTSQLVNLRSHITDGYNLQTTNDPGVGTGSGGTCSGDSGGPIFYDDTNIVVAVNSFGENANCVGGDFSFRTDRADSQEFIYNWLRP